MRKILSVVLLGMLITLSAGCRNGGGHDNDSTDISGTISGLTGTGLVLQNNGGDNITISAGSTSFTFPTALANGANYNVSVLTQPNSPLQNCTVSNGIGTVSTAVSSISVVCSAVELAYMVNNGGTAGSDSISAYSINTTTGVLTRIDTATITSPIPNTILSSIAIDRTGKFVYVTNSSEGTDYISAYSINKDTGALTNIGTYTTGNNPMGMIFDPSGKFFYVANYADNNFSAYSVNITTGVLTSIGTYATGFRNSFIAIDLTGKFAYVGGPDPDVLYVSAYSINTTTGALTSIGTDALNGYCPLTMKFDPSGKFAYVVHGGTTSTVSAYSINITTGALTNIGTYATEYDPHDIAFDPSGKFAYVANSSADSISAYSINTTTGALTSIGTYATGLFPEIITVDPSGKFAYVVNYSYFENPNSNSVSAYSINTTTGALTSIGTYAAAGLGADGIVITQVP